MRLLLFAPVGFDDPGAGGCGACPANLVAVKYRLSAAWGGPVAGFGLRGLMDRLDVRGGSLTVQIPAGRGTRLVGTIPVSVGRMRQPEEGNAG